MQDYKSKISYYRVFLICIFFSFLLHIIYMLLFDIEVEKSLSKRYNPEIIFAGSFLKEIDVKNPNLSEQILEPAVTSEIINKIMNLYPEPIFINPVVFKNSINKIKNRKNNILPPPSFIIKVNKFPSSFQELSITKSFSLEGDIANREVLYQTDFIEHEVLEESNIPSIFKFKVCILQDGKVLSVENLTSTGEPVVDRYLSYKIQSWIFTPLPQVEKVKSNSWGVIKISLND